MWWVYFSPSARLPIHEARNGTAINRVIVRYLFTETLYVRTLASAVSTESVVATLALSVHTFKVRLAKLQTDAAPFLITGVISSPCTSIYY